jgi:hypothetical protein
MDNKSNWLLGFIVAIIIIAIMLYFLGDIFGNQGMAEGNTSGLYPIVIAIVVSPFIIAFLSNSTPEQPVKGVIRACQVYDQSKRYEAMRPYLSKGFLKSPKVLLIVQWKPDKVKTIQVEVTDEKHRMIVRVVCKDHSYYVFSVTRRLPYVDPAGSTNWVVDDVQGI